MERPEDQSQAHGTSPVAEKCAITVVRFANVVKN